MTEEQDDGFLRRWARRKEEARRAEEAPEEPIPPAPVVEEAPPPVAPEPEAPPPDLPPIETLDATSDYTAFLKSGVPKLLRQAALRKAWATDPAITGHKPLVDYDWDHNAPGYGKLAPGDDVAKLVSAIFRNRPATPPPAEAEALVSPEPSEPPAAAEATQPDEPPTTPAADAPPDRLAAAELRPEAAEEDDPPRPPAAPG